MMTPIDNRPSQWPGMTRSVCKNCKLSEISMDEYYLIHLLCQFPAVSYDSCVNSLPKTRPHDNLYEIHVSRCELVS